jgi:hypothetical protein
VKALEYAKALSDTFIPGVPSWNDIVEQQGVPLRRNSTVTANGISIYVARQGRYRPRRNSNEDTLLSRCGPVGSGSASRPNCSSAVPIPGVQRSPRIRTAGEGRSSRLHAWRRKTTTSG